MRFTVQNDNRAIFEIYIQLCDHLPESSQRLHTLFQSPHIQFPFDLEEALEVPHLDLGLHEEHVLSRVVDQVAAHVFDDHARDAHDLRALRNRGFAVFGRLDVGSVSIVQLELHVDARIRGIGRELFEHQVQIRRVLVLRVTPASPIFTISGIVSSIGMTATLSGSTKLFKVETISMASVSRDFQMDWQDGKSSTESFQEGSINWKPAS